MHFNRKPLVIGLAAAVAGFTVTPIAIAQSESLAIEEVVVTARKRTESTQDVPMHILSLTGEQMKKQGKDIEAEKAKKAKESGRFYQFMIDHVKSVLADPKRV